MMAEFFYEWKRKDVWKIIAPTVTRSDKSAVKAELEKLPEDQKGTGLCKYVLLNKKPEHWLSEDNNHWSTYILPALKSLQKEKYRRFNDPIHGTIELHPLLCKIIDTPEFHRLNDIKQLGGVHYVYPNARHTRFEHSIGVCYLAGEFARTLQKKQPELKITDRDVLCVEIAGLIHDLGHGPFSHMFEYGVYEQLKLEYPKEFQKEPAAGKPSKPSGNTTQFQSRKRKRNAIGGEGPSTKKKKLHCDVEPPKWKHEILSQKVFKDRIYKSLSDEFENYGISGNDIDFITELIHYETEAVDEKYKNKGFLFQIVANKYCGIDVDKWDYFARDGHFIGVAHDFDFRRLMSMSRVNWVEDDFGKGWRICFRIKEKNNIYGMFRTRCSLFQRALHHKTKIAAELMLCRAIALAAMDVKLTHKCSIKKAVLDARKYTTESTSGSGSLDAFLTLTDGIIYAIKIADPSKKSKVQRAQKLLERLATRNLFQEVSLKETEANAKLYNIEKLQRAIHKKWKGRVFVQHVDYKYGSESIPDGDSENESTDEEKSTNEEGESVDGEESTNEEGESVDGEESTNEESESTDEEESTNEESESVEREDESKDDDDVDPVKFVYFYDKKAPTKAECEADPRIGLVQDMKVDTTVLVRPQKFSLSQIKVYSDLKYDIHKKIKELLKEYREE